MSQKQESLNDCNHLELWHGLRIIDFFVLINITPYVRVNMVIYKVLFFAVPTVRFARTTNQIRVSLILNWLAITRAIESIWTKFKSLAIYLWAILIACLQRRNLRPCAVIYIKLIWFMTKTFRSVLIEPTWARLILSYVEKVSNSCSARLLLIRRDGLVPFYKFTSHFLMSQLWIIATERLYGLVGPTRAACLFSRELSTAPATVLRVTFWPVIIKVTTGSFISVIPIAWSSVAVLNKSVILAQIVIDPILGILITFSEAFFFSRLSVLRDESLRPPD